MVFTQCLHVLKCLLKPLQPKKAENLTYFVTYSYIFWIFVLFCLKIIFISLKNLEVVVIAPILSYSNLE